MVGCDVVTKNLVVEAFGGGLAVRAQGPHCLVPVEVHWRQRRWACPDAGCPRGTFSEQLPGLVAPRGSLTARAIGWAIGQLRFEHATIDGLARRLAVSWWTLWRAVKPRLEDLAADEARFAGVPTLGVDEHVWHHTPQLAAVKGPGMFTGMVDLTRDQHGRVHARLLDLVPGRTGKAYATWLTDRTPSFRAGIKVATLDPFRGYANALRDELSEAVPVLGLGFCMIMQRSECGQFGPEGRKPEVTERQLGRVATSVATFHPMTAKKAVPGLPEMASDLR